jgi:pyruvate dehydrogenase E2 component (dihydrolipoamide acetyltransferase)
MTGTGRRRLVDIVVPQVGEAVSDVRIARWLKSAGDRVGKGEPLFEVDTDKYVIAVDAFATGTLDEILAPEGAEVAPQQVVARIAVTGTDTIASPHDASRGPGSDEPKKVALPRLGERKARSASRVRATPKARRLAAELGVALEALAGSGPNGIIEAADVEAAAQAPQTKAETRETGISSERMRRVIAERMQLSKQTVPHFYVSADVDMSEAVRLRAHAESELGWDRPPTYTELLVRACARALAASPRVNVSYDSALRGLVARSTVDIGIAVALEEGLVVPVLSGADRIGLEETSRRLRGLMARAQSGRLEPGDVGSKSMVVSNLGATGVDAFVAVIDIPDPVILAAGRVGDRVVAIDGAHAVRPICTLTLSVDHRALDGVPAARFLVLVKGELESAFNLLEP